VAWIPKRDDDEERVRVAYAVPRAVGGSVVRNRVRRRLRPMISEQAAAGLPPGAYLVGVRDGAMHLPAAELRRHLAAAIRTATRSGGR
jgi:ribonuclease P protein component